MTLTGLAGQYSFRYFIFIPRSDRDTATNVTRWYTSQYYDVRNRQHLFNEDAHGQGAVFTPSHAHDRCSSGIAMVLNDLATGGSSDWKSALRMRCEMIIVNSDKPHGSVPSVLYLQGCSCFYYYAEPIGPALFMGLPRANYFYILLYFDKKVN
jgi:hypothetical protein